MRMSTDHQKYSTENQSTAIRAYAAQRGLTIVRTYADEGKSGLRIEGRDALRRLIDDVEGGSADFDVILVYDVSRWGRFQDADESAYYEYRCRRAGIEVEYCAEQFANDGSPTATIVKGVKRAMAGEYSRELSAKVFAGQGRLIEHGFRQGGAAGFGLRRMRVNQHGERQGILGIGEQKSLQTDRVVLVPGPPEEVETVRWMYRAFVQEGKPEREIAETLNGRGIMTDLGRPWTRGTVHQVLINPKYVGHNVWNRVSFKLKRKRVRNRPDMWIKAEGAFAGIVAGPLFEEAQRIIADRSRRLTDEEMLRGLRTLYEIHGRLSGLIIDEMEDLPSSSTYGHRFGGLLRAYRLVGYSPRRDYRYIDINRSLRRLHPEILAEIITGLKTSGAVVQRNEDTDLLTVNGEVSLAVVIARCKETPAGALRWMLRFDNGNDPDILVAIRMDARNERPIDYYLFPRIDQTAERIRLAEENGLSLDAYRVETLDLLYELAAPVRIRAVA
uniref:recombinase family protein n=1 Tax=Roseospira marina TaxID=140057 RepID=UPI002482194E|nr:recombinase family protein [Roseospira marina]